MAERAVRPGRRSRSFNALVVLCFLRHRGAVLLIEGSARKPWAGRLQGIGGGVQPGEDPLRSAIREIREETGLEVQADDQHLKGIVLSQNFYGRDKLVLLFAASVRSRQVRAGQEGRLHWIPLRSLARQQNLIPDLYALIPRVFALRAGETLSGVSVFDGGGGLRSLELVTVKRRLWPPTARESVGLLSRGRMPTRVREAR